MLYSKTTSGFYDAAIHGNNIPADAVEISAEEHSALINGQSQGKRIVADENGYPILIDPPVINVVQKPKFTSLEFLDLFTEEEQLAIVSASMQSAQVKLWYDRTLAAMYITLDDNRTEAGLDALVDAGLLSVGRKAEIVEAMQ